MTLIQEWGSFWVWIELVILEWPPIISPSLEQPEAIGRNMKDLEVIQENMDLLTEPKQASVYR